MALMHPDWQLMSFGVSAIGHVLLLVYAPLLAAIGLVFVLVPRPPAARRVARRQTLVIAIILFSIAAVSAAGYATFLFLSFFGMFVVQDPGELLVTLVWVTALVCFPWAHVAAIESNHEPRTVNVDLVFAALAVGCVPIIAVTVYTGTPVSQQFIVATFAVTMSVGLVASICRIWWWQARALISA